MKNCGVHLTLSLTGLLLALAPCLSAQTASLKPYAHVLDLDTGIGLAGVPVSIPGTNQVEYTDNLGYVYFPGYTPTSNWAEAFTSPSSLGYGPSFSSRRSNADRLLNLFVPPFGNPLQVDDGIPDL